MVDGTGCEVTDGCADIGAEAGGVRIEEFLVK